MTASSPSRIACRGDVRSISLRDPPDRGGFFMPVASSLRAFLLAAALLPAAAHAAPRAHAAHPAPAARDADTRLRQLFHDTDEASLERNPLQALYRGDLRYAGQLGDPFSDAHMAAE